jgi:hypothetical protein
MAGVYRGRATCRRTQQAVTQHGDLHILPIGARPAAIPMIRRRIRTVPHAVDSHGMSRTYAGPSFVTELQSASRPPRDLLKGRRSREDYLDDALSTRKEPFVDALNPRVVASSPTRRGRPRCVDEGRRDRQ